MIRRFLQRSSLQTTSHQSETKPSNSTAGCVWFDLQGPKVSLGFRLLPLNWQGLFKMVKGSFQSRARHNSISMTRLEKNGMQRMSEAQLGVVYLDKCFFLGGEPENGVFSFGFP